MTAKDRRGLFIGLIVGLITSAGVAAASGTPVQAFIWSAATVILVVGLIALVTGLVRR